jgi:hypothetical protein
MGMPSQFDWLELNGAYRTVEIVSAHKQLPRWSCFH